LATVERLVLPGMDDMTNQVLGLLLSFPGKDEHLKKRPNRDDTR